MATPDEAREGNPIAPLLLAKFSHPYFIKAIAPRDGRKVRSLS
ncbi:MULTISPECIES: hypothetical protein [Aerosakkonema]